jgi:hypothetical protein
LPARLRNYKNLRSSSWDRTGGNDDWVGVDPGQGATLLDVHGAGVVTHIWFTINSPDPVHLKNLVLRAWWDGEADALDRSSRSATFSARRQELRNRIQVVAHGDQRRLNGAVLARLRVADIGHQRIAQALAATVSSILPPLAT